MLKNMLFCIVCLWLEFICIQDFFWKRCLEKKTEKKTPAETPPITLALGPLAASQPPGFPSRPGPARCGPSRAVGAPLSLDSLTAGSLFFFQ